MPERIKQLLIALVALLGYGGWAYISNMQVDTDIALRAACIQGSYAGLLTLVNVILLEWMFLKLNASLSCRANLLATLTIATALQYAIIVPVHWLNQTPNIVLTLAPGFVIGSTFSYVYLLTLKNKYYPTADREL